MSLLTSPFVPEGMVELMTGLSKSVIKDRPQNIYEFAAEFFEKMLIERDGSLDKGYGKFRSYTEYCKFMDKMEQRRLKQPVNYDEMDRVKTNDGNKFTDASTGEMVSKTNIKIQGVAMQGVERKPNVKNVSINPKYKNQSDVEREIVRKPMVSSVKNVKPKPRKLSSKKPSENLIVIKEETSTDVDDIASNEESNLYKSAVVIQKAVRKYLSSQADPTIPRQNMDGDNTNVKQEKQFEPNQLVHNAVYDSSDEAKKIESQNQVADSDNITSILDIEAKQNQTEEIHDTSVRVADEFEMKSEQIQITENTSNSATDEGNVQFEHSQFTADAPNDIEGNQDLESKSKQNEISASASVGIDGDRGVESESPSKQDLLTETASHVNTAERDIESELKEDQIIGSAAQATEGELAMESKQDQITAKTLYDTEGEPAIQSKQDQITSSAPHDTESGQEMESESKLIEIKENASHENEITSASHENEITSASHDIEGQLIMESELKQDQITESASSHDIEGEQSKLNQVTRSASQNNVGDPAMESESKSTQLTVETSNNINKTEMESNVNELIHSSSDENLRQPGSESDERECVLDDKGRQDMEIKQNQSNISGNTAEIQDMDRLNQPTENPSDQDKPQPEIQSKHEQVTDVVSEGITHGQEIETKSHELSPVTANNTPVDKNMESTANQVTEDTKGIPVKGMDQPTISREEHVDLKSDNELMSHTGDPSERTEDPNKQTEEVETNLFTVKNDDIYVNLDLLQEKLGKDTIDEIGCNSEKSFNLNIHEREEILVNQENLQHIDDEQHLVIPKEQIAIDTAESSEFVKVPNEEDLEENLEDKNLKPKEEEGNEEYELAETVVLDDIAVKQDTQDEQKMSTQTMVIDKTYTPDILLHNIDPQKNQKHTIQPFNLKRYDADKEEMQSPNSPLKNDQCLEQESENSVLTKTPDTNVNTVDILKDKTSEIPIDLPRKDSTNDEIRDDLFTVSSTENLATATERSTNSEDEINSAGATSDIPTTKSKITENMIPDDNAQENSTKSLKTEESTKLSEQVNVEETLEKTNVEKTLEKANVEKTSGQVNLQKPSEQVNMEKTSEQVNMENISHPVSVQKISEHVNVDTTSEQVDVEKTPEQVNMEKNSEQVDVEKTPEQVNMEKNSEQLNVEKTSEQVNVERTPRQLNVEKNSEQVSMEKNSDQVNVEKTLEQANVDTTPEQVNVGKTSEQVNVEKNSEQVNVEKTSEQVNVEKTSEQVNVEETLEQVNVEKTSEQVNVENTPEHVNVERAPEQLNVEKNSEQLNVEITSEQVNVEKTPEQANVEKTSEQVNVDTTLEQVNVGKMSEQVNVEKISEHVNVEKTSEQLNVENTPEQVNLDKNSEQPNVENTSEQLNFEESKSSYLLEHEHIRAEKNNLPNVNQLEKCDGNDKLAKAATAIQRVFRGYIVRKSKLINLNNESNELKLSAALTIQKYVRGYLARRHLTKVNGHQIIHVTSNETNENPESMQSKSADYVQNASMAHRPTYSNRFLIPKDSFLERESFADDEDYAKTCKELAATSIQKTYRGYRVRRSLKNDYDSGTPIHNKTEENFSEDLKTENEFLDDGQVKSDEIETKHVLSAVLSAAADVLPLKTQESNTTENSPQHTSASPDHNMNVASNHEGKILINETPTDLSINTIPVPSAPTLEDDSILGPVVNDNIHVEGQMQQKYNQMTFQDNPINPIEELSDSSEQLDTPRTQKIGASVTTPTISNSKESTFDAVKSFSYEQLSSDLSDTDDIKRESFKESEIDETSRDERDDLSEVENFDLSSCGEDSLEAMYYSIRKNEIMLDKMQKHVAEHRDSKNEELGLVASENSKVEFPERITENLDETMKQVFKSIESSSDYDGGNKDDGEDSTTLDIGLDDSSSLNDEKEIETSRHIKRSEEINIEHMESESTETYSEGNENERIKEAPLNTDDSESSDQNFTSHIGLSTDRDQQSFNSLSPITRLMIKSQSVGDEMMNPIMFAMKRKQALLDQLHVRPYPLQENLSEDHDDFPDHLLTDMDLGNIQRKIFASSVSETDSDYIEPTTNRRLVRDDFNISTALDHLSTDSESTIVSAATKIQAGARGFLTRRRLRRSSAGGTSVSFEKRYSFGNAAIDKSLEDLINRQEQINLDGAALKIQQQFRKYRDRKRNLKKVSPIREQTLELSSDSSGEGNYKEIIGIRDIKVAQKKTNHDDDDGENTKNDSEDNLQGNERSSSLNIDDVTTAPSVKTTLINQRRLTLQRGDAVQRNSRPDSPELNVKQVNLSSDGDEKYKDYETGEYNGSMAIKTKKKVTPYINIQSLINRGIGPRQRSMPVQIDSELMRIIPKHLRKRVKSADIVKKKSH